MKKLIIVGVCLGLFSGCVNMNYVSPSGERFEYNRLLGLQKIEGFKMNKDDKGLLSVEFDKQEGSAGELIEVMKNVSALMSKMVTPVP